MGREYKIKFAVPVGYEPASLFLRLPSPIDRRTMTEIYNYAIEADGFYFIDHLVDREVAAVALRNLHEEALWARTFGRGRRAVSRSSSPHQGALDHSQAPSSNRNPIGRFVWT